MPAGPHRLGHRRAPGAAARPPAWPPLALPVVMGAGRRGSMRESAVPQAVLLGRGAVVVPHHSRPASSPSE